MSAPRGNKNAQKWTLAKTDEVLRQIESMSLKPAIHFLTQAEELAGVYPAIWSYWQSIWIEDPDIIHRMKIVELRFHNKLLKAAMDGRIKAGLAKILLENNYGSADPRPDKSGILRHSLPVVPPRLSEVTVVEDIRDIPPLGPPRVDEPIDTGADSPDISPVHQDIPASDHTQYAEHRDHLHGEPLIEHTVIEDKPQQDQKPKPPAIRVTPSVNAGRFHLEVAQVEGGVYIFTDHLQREVLRIPQTSSRQYVDMGDPDAGIYTVTLQGLDGTVELGYFNAQDRRYRDRIPPIIP